MARAHVDYTAGGAVPDGYQGFNPDQPVTGFYRMRLRSGGHPVGIRVWFGAPLDPVTGEELDRSHRWQALANDRPIDLERVWPKCATAPIDEREYRYLTGVQDWGEQHDPNSPQANPHQKINPLTAPTPF